MSSRFVPFLGACVSAALLLLSGCSGDDNGGEEGTEESPGTGVTCPPGGTTLTYQNFGQAFMNSYCVRCHSSALTGAARNGAPPDANWDTVEAIRAEADEIHEMAGASDTETNEAMPPNGDKPSVEDRRRLSEWLACGAP